MNSQWNKFLLATVLNLCLLNTYIIMLKSSLTVLKYIYDYKVTCGNQCMS